MTTNQEKQRRTERQAKCRARWDGERCGEPLTTADRLNNGSGLCVRCAEVLSDNGEW